ncbi:hypothetical protein PINS_up004337 [Pythium insidiosum]|nr:hypothetical protein PINS_up004337 [Pythium insidiosum]
MPLPLYARCGFERKEDATKTALLLLASTESRWNALALLLERNSPQRESVDATRYSDGRTLLHVAAEAGNLALVRLLSSKDGRQLLTRAEAINTRQKGGSTALHVACRDGKISMIKGLLDMGADLSAEDQDGNTPLHAACFNLCVDVVQLLVENGDADIDAQNNALATPLMATLTQSDMTFRGPVVRVAVTLVENFAESSE